MECAEVSLKEVVILDFRVCNEGLVRLGRVWGMTRIIGFVVFKIL